MMHTTNVIIICEIVQISSGVTHADEYMNLMMSACLPLKNKN